MSEVGSPFTIAEARDALSKLEQMHDAVGQFIDANSNEPLPSCRAEIEGRELSSSAPIESAYAQCGLLIDVSADHLASFIRLVEEPVQTIAPWTCIRVTLETSAIAAWLADSRADAITRASRSFARRYEGLMQQVKYANSCGKEGSAGNVEERIDQVQQQATELGLAAVFDKKGRRIGIGQVMPHVTSLVGEMLDQEANYRMLSSIAHAHHWALTQSSFKVVREGGRLFVERHITPFWIVAMCRMAASAFVVPVRDWSSAYGWDKEKLEEALRPAAEIHSLKPGPPSM